MSSSSTLKRQNFNVTPEEEDQLQRLRETLGAASVKDAVLRATRILLTLAQEIEEGKRIYTADSTGIKTRLLLPDMEAPAKEQWKYLAPRPQSWKRQLFVKGKRLTAANVWSDMLANSWSIEETAYNWDLTTDAVNEIIVYCELEQELIGMEADAEKRILLAHGVALTPESRL